MARLIVFLTLLFAIAAPAVAQQLIVFPAVSNEVEGLNGSRWVTEARIVKVDPRADVTLTRKWVCTPDGGFVEDPGDPFVIRMHGGSEQGRVERLWGDELLWDADVDLGAVAYEVSGGGVIATSYVVDVSRGEYQPWMYTAGQGQFVRAMEEPLVGPAHIPWLAGCRNLTCSRQNSVYWNFHRNNIGIVNPNPEPLAITGTVLGFGGAFTDVTEIYPAETPEEFRKEIPPYGWLQFKWVSDEIYYGGLFGGYFFPEGGFLINLVPDKDIPYYAYASVVFSPDPESDNQVFSDPLFVPAEPGYIEPYREAFPPKGKER